MGMNDGLAERKPKPKTSAAVANRIAPGKKHSKTRSFSSSGIPGPLSLTQIRPYFSRDCRDPDVRASRSIFDCVVHQVDKHLHDESCIHPHQQRLISAIYCNVMLRRPSVDMPERFRHNIVHDLIGKAQLDAAVRDFRNGK